MKRESMKPYPAILLRDFDKTRTGDRFYKEGEQYFATKFPSGQWMLLEKQHLIFAPTAVEGVDFVFRDYDVYH